MIKIIVALIQKNRLGVHYYPYFFVDNKPASLFEYIITAIWGKNLNFIEILKNIDKQIKNHLYNKEKFKLDEFKKITQEKTQLENEIKKLETQLQQIESIN